MRPTIVDVSKRAGVCTVTASRVLNGSPTVREKTRQKVLRAAEELGYVPNSTARSLRSGKCGAIGVILPALNDPFMFGVVAGAEEESWRRGYFTLISQTRAAQYKSEGEYVKLLIQGRVDGLIVVTPRHDEEYILELRRRGVPLVLADKHGARIGVPSVTVDNFEGAYAATKHLIEMGHRNIGHLVGHPEMESSFERLRGYQQALTDAGIEYRPEFVLNGWYRPEVARESVMTWISQGSLPTAILACDDNVAFEVMSVLAQHGICVPQQVAVAGFDDDRMGTRISPTLTSVNLRSSEAGREAVNLLVGQIDGGNNGPVPSIVIKPELIMRQSTSFRRILDDRSR